MLPFNPGILVAWLRGEDRRRELERRRLLASVRGPGTEFGRPRPPATDSPTAAEQRLAAWRSAVQEATEYLERGEPATAISELSQTIATGRRRGFRFAAGQRDVFARALMLRSRAHGDLGQWRRALADLDLLLLIAPKRVGLRERIARERAQVLDHLAPSAPEST